MAEFLKLKKSNCKNCYKCIRHCPVKSIRFSGNQANIVGNECILCGQCFVVCPQNAKQIADSTELVRTLLGGGEPVIASIAPSFIANYEDVGIDELREALRKIGFADAEETAIGATIVKREYEHILAEGRQDVLISSCCHSVNLLIQKYFPAELPYLAGCERRAGTFRGISSEGTDAKTVSMRSVCREKGMRQIIIRDARCGSLTFEERRNWFGREHVTLRKNKDKNPDSRARFFPTTGGILKTMDCSAAGYTYLAIDGVENCMAALRDIEEGKLHKCFIEMSACVGSCVGGPVMEKYHRSPVRSYIAVFRICRQKRF